MAALWQFITPSIRAQLEIKKLIVSLIISIIVSGILPSVEAGRLVGWTSHRDVSPQLPDDHLVSLVLLSQPDDLCLQDLYLFNQVDVLVSPQLLQFLLHRLVYSVVFFYLVTKLLVHPLYFRLFEGQLFPQLQEGPRSIA